MTNEHPTRKQLLELLAAELPDLHLEINIKEVNSSAPRNHPTEVFDNHIDYLGRFRDLKKSYRIVSERTVTVIEIEPRFLDLFSGGGGEQ